MEQAFALLAMVGSCGARHTVETGLREAAREDVEQIDAWVSIGNCVNRISARQTCH
jgi:hypothetical protein